MIPVLSSNVRAIGYDDGASVLHVRFRDSTRVYRYRGVSGSVYRAFMVAPSKGRFFAWNIKGRYPVSWAA